MNREEKYKAVCEDYVLTFCKKQDLEFEGWVDTVGGIALCSDYYFNFQDIVWDINSEQPSKSIIEWYEFVLEFPTDSVNYYTWTKIPPNEIRK